MASREKRPLAPSKSKQKASNDSGLPSNEVRNKKGKSLPSVKQQQQLAQEIFDTVATGSQLSVKLEVSLPRRNALKNLKRKQNLRAAKANLKSKVTKKETSKNIHRIVKRGVKAKRIKQSEESAVKTVDTASRLSENQTSNRDNEGKGSETPSKSAKNNLRTKKVKADVQNKEEASVKVSPKLGRKGKATESPDSLSKGAKTGKLTNLKRNNTKDNNFIKAAEDNRDLHKGAAKSRKSGSGKELDSLSVKSNSSVEKFPKAVLDDKNSIDLTIDEVIASSMLSDNETENQQGVTERTEGKVTRSRKMLVDENIICDIEIKKEPETDDIKVTSDGEYAEDQGIQNAIQLRKRSKVGYVDVQVSQRSLRNGKQRQLSDSGNSPDNDSKKRHRLNSDGTAISDNSMEHISDCNTNMDSCFSDHSCNESQTAVASSKEEMCLKDEVSKNFDEEADIGSEVENNNNSDRVDRTGETGPTLRSKTKAKTIENEATKDEDVKTEDPRIPPKCEAQEDSKKLNNLDQTRKDNSILAKFTDKSKGRRGSLNIDMKKTVNSFYSTDKSDGNSKSQIDQMIENIKLNIAKTIESKIFGPEKGLGLSKNFDVKTEIVAPLSTDSQKMGLEESADEDGSAVTKNEITSDSSENSVPKVADTAKEIEEKLVKSDIGEAETHSQNIQEDRVSDGDRIHNVHNICESTCNISNDSGAAAVYNSQDESENENVGCSTAGDAFDSESKTSQDESKKMATRKSPRISDKTADNVLEARKSNSRTPSKTISRLEDPPESLDDDVTTSLPSQAEERLAEKPVEAEGSEITCSSNSEESETLESISREVERLVAEDEDARLSLLNAANDTEPSEENLLVPENPDSQELEVQRANKQEASDDSSMTSESATDANEISRSADETSREERGDASKTNNSTTTTNCDSNSDSSSSVNSVPARSPESKELKARSGDPTSDESVSENQNPELSETADPINDKSPDNKDPEETRKPDGEKSKRVLRARDKQKKGRDEGRVKVKQEETAGGSVHQRKTPSSDEMPAMDATRVSEGGSRKPEDSNESDESSQSRTRRSRDMKRIRKEDPASSKVKRVKRDTRKSDQQTKEETLLDNEVAKINENNRSFLSKYADEVEGHPGEDDDSFREAFFEEREPDEELQDAKKKGPGTGVRSKSENDIAIEAKGSKGAEKRQLSRNLSENHVSSKQTPDHGIQGMLGNECKSPKDAPKDSDETSTSGESCNGDNMGKILETPEDKERKESILRTLGLESLEEAAKRQNQQKIRKEQSSGTLKTVIKVSQKDKDKDKRGSGPPLKMIVLKQGRADGEGDSPEIYTIQKEFGGPSGLGDSSSGANRKFTTNHRYSCDDDNEDAAPKDRQSLVIPEKSSSFSIHPGRVCADVCSYCFGKFGSLDTPMHLAQLKSDERRKKILNFERHLTKDSCLCDACYRHVDRKANTSPTNLQQKPQKQHRQLMVTKCSARECRDPARHHVKRRWLVKIKASLQNQVDIDWDSSQHTQMPLCVSHYEKVECYLMCALCKRRLIRTHTHTLTKAEIDEFNQLASPQGIPVLLQGCTYVCKLCRYFVQLQLKYRDLENMNTNHKIFSKSYRKRILHSRGIEVADDEDEDSSQQATNPAKDKKSKKSSKGAQVKSGSSKSPEHVTSGTSEKSTPEPNKNEGRPSSCENRAAKTSGDESGGNISSLSYFGSIESTVENLKKRKMLDLHAYPLTGDGATTAANEMAEILGMDNEVTLTRLPKRPRLNNSSNNSSVNNNSSSNDITPVVQRLGANPSISVRTLFPGEEEMNLHVNIDFQNVREVTPQGWEKCATMIQYDRETKHLWQQLQRPYGNQSSFLRHLIILEKYYRAGDLILAPNASRNAINYSTSVQNRLISYEGPEKMDEPIMEPIATEYNSRRLSGGFVMEKNRPPGPSSMSGRPTSGGAASLHSTKMNSPRMLKLNSGVSIIKKPPPSLQRLSLPSTSGGSGPTTNGGVKRRDGQSLPSAYAGKVFQLSEQDMKRTQHSSSKRQSKSNERHFGAGSGSSSYQKTSQVAAAIPGHSQQFQRHLRLQQEMLSRQSRGDFEPLICDMATRGHPAANENSPTGQNLIHNLNLPKSIQVTTKPTMTSSSSSSTSSPIPILPKIPRSLTVIPQTVTRPAADK
ncbi:uncharacterized protein LOC114944613 isoform X2 [Nylanderia fulva]|nr:uncharacterized protein LOC114944613 isoform X2 [Nylanderia fulva]